MRRKKESGASIKNNFERIKKMTPCALRGQILSTEEILEAEASAYVNQILIGESPKARRAVRVGGAIHLHEHSLATWGDFGEQRRLSGSPWDNGERGEKTSGMLA